MAKEIEVQGITVAYRKVSENDYISLTDLAKYKNSESPNEVIRNWLRNRMTIEYLGVWETLYNPDFKPVEFDGFRMEAGTNGFILSPQKWTDATNAIGIKASAGRYGGTFAHKDIAFKFASWLSVEFELYLIKEFQRLKAEENKQIEWTAKRELAKVNYRIHTDAIKEYLVPALSPAQLNYVYANEADLLNVAMFGTTAAEWRNSNPDKKGNIRDYATVEQLLVLANMESYNSILIEQNKSQGERLKLLNAMAKSQMKVLQNYTVNIPAITK